MSFYLKFSRLLVVTTIVLTAIAWSMDNSSVNGGLFIVSLFLAMLSAILMNKVSYGRFFNVEYETEIIPRWYAILVVFFIFGGVILFFVSGSFPVIQIITMLFLLLTYCFVNQSLTRNLKDS